MNGNSPVPSQNTPAQRVEDLPIYLQASLGTGTHPFEYAEMRSGGGLVRYSSIRVYNGPVNSGNTTHNHSGGLLMRLLIAGGVILVVVIVLQSLLGGAA